MTVGTKDVYIYDTYKEIERRAICSCYTKIDSSLDVQRFYICILKKERRIREMVRECVECNGEWIERLYRYTI